MFVTTPLDSTVHRPPAAHAGSLRVGWRLGGGVRLVGVVVGSFTLFLKEGWAMRRVPASARPFHFARGTDEGEAARIGFLFLHLRLVV